MSSWERRIVHIALRENSDVETRSIGEEPTRRVLVCPKASSSPVRLRAQKASARASIGWHVSADFQILVYRSPQLLFAVGFCLTALCLLDKAPCGEKLLYGLRQSFLCDTVGLLCGDNWRNNRQCTLKNCHSFFRAPLAQENFSAADYPPARMLCGGLAGIYRLRRLGMPLFSFADSAAVPAAAMIAITATAVF